MAKITKRQQNILDFIRRKGPVGNQEIKESVGDISRVTIVRDIDNLIAEGLIKKKGKGRGVRYTGKIQSEPLSFVDVDEYFKKSPDQREVAFERFNFEVFKKIKDIFSEDELKELNDLNNDYKKRVKTISPAILKKEFERLTIELSWRSSQIEGNTYSLLDTEVLIKEHKEALGHKKDEAVMILNHKKALDYIIDKKSNFKELTISKIENIHSLMVKNMEVGRGLRKRPVGITGTVYRPLGNEHQIRESMTAAIKAINGMKDPFSKALFAIVIISYIQPFEDGNKRTARLLGNAILLAHDVCPLSFRSVDEVEYKKAMVLFYEQNSLRFFKELFIEQFKFAVKNYFLA